METLLLETVALLPDGRPMLSYGTRGQDPALAGGLTSALYSFTREIDLRKTPSDGLKIDVPGGGKLVLRRSILSGREVLVSVIVRGIVNEQILNVLSEFGRALGEVLTSIQDWRDITRGSFSSLFASKADIYLETLRRWRASTRWRPLVQIEYKDVIRSTLSVLGKTVKLSEPFLGTVSDPNLSLSQDELLKLVGKEIVILTSDQELFLALNAKDDQVKVAVSVAGELQGLKTQALGEAQKILEEVKKSFIQAIAGSINGETAFFRIGERRQTWTNEITRAVYRRLSKRFPHLILAHPSLAGVGSSKGIREMISEFIEGFLVEKGPYGMMKKLLSNLKVDPALTQILNKFVETCGPEFTESDARFVASLTGPQTLKEALASLTESDALGKSFEISLIDTSSKDMSTKDSGEWVELKSKVYRIIAETYAEILEDILIGKGLLVEKAKATRGYLSGVLSTYQIVMALNLLAEHNWKTVNMRGQIPTYAELLSTAIANQLITKENDTIIVEGEKHIEALKSRDSLLMKTLWGNWVILSATLKEKMTGIIENEFHQPLQLFLQNCCQAVRNNLDRFGDCARTVGTGGDLRPPTIDKPGAERKIYEPLREDSEKIYDLIMTLYEKSSSFIKSTVEEMAESERGKRVAIAKQVVYTLDKIQKDYLLSPEESLRRRLEATVDGALKRVDSEIASLKDGLLSCFRQGPPFLKYIDGELADPSSSVGTFKPPPVESFFQGGYKEILRAYSSVALGLAIPDYMVKRAVLQLRDKKQTSPILKPLLKVKEANLDKVVSMHLSEYVRIFTENAFSFASHHIDESYISSIGTESVTVGLVPLDYLRDPSEYIGKPLGIEWVKSKDTWVFRMIRPELHAAEQNPLQRVLDQQFLRILQEKYGATFELLVRIGNTLSPEEGKRVEASIQRLAMSLVSGAP